MFCGKNVFVNEHKLLVRKLQQQTFFWLLESLDSFSLSFFFLLPLPLFLSLAEGKNSNFTTFTISRSFTFRFREREGRKTWRKRGKNLREKERDNCLRLFSLSRKGEEKSFLLVYLPMQKIFSSAEVIPSYFLILFSSFWQERKKKVRI